MCLHLGVTDHEGHICEVLALEHAEEVLRHLGLWHLHSDGEHPYVVEAQFAIVSSENVELSLDDVGGVSAARSWLELAGHHLLPVVAVDVEHMDVVHPVHPVVAAEVDDFGVDEAPSRGDSGAWFVATHLRLHPRERFRVQVEDVIQLPQLVGLSAKDIDLFVEGDG